MILGSTYTGHYEPVKEMSEMLDAYEAKTGISVPIHVDGVSSQKLSIYMCLKLRPILRANSIFRRQELLLHRLLILIYYGTLKFLEWCLSTPLGISSASPT